MQRNFTKKIESSFLSCPKDTKLILKKLFVDVKEHSDILKRLLVINTPDCLDPAKYQDIVDSYNLKRLFEEGYLRTKPKINLPEHEEIKAYIILNFDNFIPSDNFQFRDNTVSFDIICHTDYWNINDFIIRPLQIAGYIDGLLHDIKLTGIGTFQFLGCNELVLSEHLSGYTLSFIAVHGSDDRIPEKDIEDDFSD